MCNPCEGDKCFFLEERDVSVVLASDGAWKRDASSSLKLRDIIWKKTGISLVFRKRDVLSGNGLKPKGTALCACSMHKVSQGGCKVLYKVEVLWFEAKAAIRIQRHEKSSGFHTHFVHGRPRATLASYEDAVASSKILSAFKDAQKISPSFLSGLLNLEFPEAEFNPRALSHLHKTHFTNNFNELFGVSSHSDDFASLRAMKAG